MRRRWKHIFVIELVSDVVLAAFSLVAESFASTR
jgi:hypothetical protein